MGARIVGTAAVKVTLDTTGLKSEMQRDVKDELGASIKGDELDPGLKKNQAAAKKSAVNIGAIFAGIWAGVRSAAIAGLAGLIPAAAGSILQVTGLLGLIPAAALGGIVTIATLKIGLSGLGQAFKDVGTPAFAKDVKSLAPAAAQFVVQVHSLSGAFKGLQLTVQQQLFSGLGRVVKELGAEYLPLLKANLGGIAGTLNGFGQDIGEWFSWPNVIRDVNTALGNVGKAFAALEPAFIAILHAFDDLSTVGSSFLPSLAQSVSDVAKRFADFLDKARASGQLGQWIQAGITAVHQLAQVVGNVLAIVVKVFGDLSANGASLFAILDQVTGTLRQFLNTAQGAQFLQALGEILRTIASTVGPLFLTLMKALVPLLTQLAPVVSAAVAQLRGPLLGVLTQLGGVLVQLAPTLVQLVQYLGVLLVGALQVLQPILSALNALLGVNAGATKQVALAVTVGILGWLTWTNVLVKVIESAKKFRVALIEMQLAQKLAAAWQVILNAVTAINPWVIVAVAIIAVVALIILNWGKVQRFLIAAWHEIVAVAKVVWGSIAGFFTDVWHGIQRVATTVWNAIAGFLTRAWNAIVNSTRFIWQPIVQIIKDIFSIVKSIIIIIVDGIAILLITAWKGMVAFAKLIWTPIAGFFTDLWNGIAAIATTVWTAIAGFFTDVWTAIAGFFTDVWNVILVVAKFIWGVIAGAIIDEWNLLVAAYHTIIEPIGRFFADLWGGIKDIAVTVWTAIVGFFGDVWHAIVSLFHAVFDPVVSFFSGIWNSVYRVISAAWDQIKAAVSDAVNAIISFISGIPGKVLNALGDLGKLLYNAGKALITGLLNGIVDAFNTVAQFVGGIADWISSHKGPIDYDRTLLIPHGQAIMQSLITGLASQLPALTGFLAGVTGGIAGAFTTSATLTGYNPGGGAPTVTPVTAVAGSTTINAYQLPGTDVLQFASQVARLGAHNVAGGGTVPVNQQPVQLGYTGKTVVGVAG